MRDMRCNMFDMRCYASTLGLMHKRIPHIYGETAIPSDYCADCEDRSLIVDSKFNCCKGPVAYKTPDDYRCECDFVGAPRKLPRKNKMQLILKIQKGRCLYCDAPFGSTRFRKGYLEVVALEWDHYIPFSVTRQNYDFVAACTACNRHKSSRIFNSVDEIRAYCKPLYA